MTESGESGEAGTRGDRGWPLLLFIVVVAFVPALFARDVWAGSEVRYVEVARQMAEYGDPLVLHLNGEVYGQKPPLFFWLTAVIGAIVGDYGLGGRLLCLVATLVAALCTGRIALLVFDDRRIALLSTLVLLTFAGVLERGQEALLDPLVLCFATCGTLSLLHAALARGSARVGWTLVATAMLAAGCMTKGPVGVLYPAIAAALVGGFWRGRPGIAVVPTIVAFVGGGLVTLLWLYLASKAAGGDLWNDLLVKQTASRIEGTAPHTRPWHFYLVVAPLLMMPWTVFLPGAVGAVLPERRRAAAPAIGMFWWFGLSLFLFSLMGPKRFGYILPSLPAAAIVLGFGLQRAEAGGVWKGSRWLVRFPLLVVVPWVLVAVGVALLVAAMLPAVVSDPGSLPLWLQLFSTPLLVAMAMIGLAILFVALRCFHAARRQDLRAATTLLVAAAALGGLFVHGVVAHAVDPIASFRPFVRAVTEALPEGERPVLLVDELDGRINLFSGERHYETAAEDELEEVLARPGKTWLIGRERYWVGVPKPIRDRFEVVIERLVGYPKRRSYFLWREKP